LLSVAVIVLTVGAAAQSVMLSGNVVDKETGQPVINAAVYLEGTSTAVVTDNDGKYVLLLKSQINTRLIISHISYEKIEITEPYDTLQRTVYMMPKTLDLSEITVTVKKSKYSRKEMLKAFRRQFLGYDQAAKECRIVNEDSLVLRYDDANKELTAFSYSPIEIENNYLGYRILVDLEDVKIKYKRNIKDDEGSIMYNNGTMRFEDLAPDLGTIATRREEAYSRTPVCFFRSLASGQLNSSRYIFLQKGNLLSRDDIFTVKDSPEGDGIKTIIVKRYLTDNQEITIDICRLSPDNPILGMVYSQITFLTDTIRFDLKTNRIEPEKAIILSGEMGMQRLGSTLPLDYKPESQRINIAELSPLDRIKYQTNAFPQEKIYIQTDKPYYLAGEMIYYRLFLLDAVMNSPLSLSRYVYVELIDRSGAIVMRQKIRPESVNLFYGTVGIPAKLPQGSYRLRAYTQFMQNFDTEHFYSKHLFIVAENKQHLKVEINASAKDNRHTTVDLRFADIKSGNTVSPPKLLLQLNGKTQKLKSVSDEGVCSYDLKLTDADRNRNIYISAFDENDSVVFHLRDIVPYARDSIDLTFYPEGGYVIDNKMNNIAFKALHQDGKAADIKGVIIDEQGAAVVSFDTKHEGMGAFALPLHSGKRYFAEYKEDSVAYRKQLPDFKRSNVSLNALWSNDSLRIFINHAESDALTGVNLLIHSRGNVLYYEPWNKNTDTLVVSKEDLLSGVTHLLLLNNDYRIISERLVFVNKNDFTAPSITPDKKEYGHRDRVKLNFDIADNQTASFAVSVTADSEVEIDTMSNILTHMLLESELQGYIADPAYYFDNAYEADLLMMTHGWSRYDMPKIMRGETEPPEIGYEKYQTLNGIVKGGLALRPAPDVEVSVLSFLGDNKQFDVTRTDANGRFRFDKIEMPDSAKFIIQVLKGKKRTKGMLEVFPDTVSYPATEAFYLPDYQSKPFLEEMIADTDRQFEVIDGMRIITLPEIVVKSKRLYRTPKNKTTGFLEPDFFITAEEIAETGITDVLTLISKLPSVRIKYQGANTKVMINTVGVEGTESEAQVLINGVSFADDKTEFQDPDAEDYGTENTFSNHDVSLMGLVIISDIEEILLINRTSKSNTGIIDIRTKGGLFYDRRARFHFKAVMPLGYSTPAEFYSPQYDTPEKRNADEPDLRATIYWKPSVAVDADGKASVDFYTADKDTPYSVVTEGVCADGRLIYRRAKELVNVK
jgi:hypothetical protein